MTTNTTITLHLPGAVPLAALHALADSVDCTLHHRAVGGFYLHQKGPFAETGMIRNIAIDLCAAWSSGGDRAINYTQAAHSMAVLSEDLDAADDLYALWAIAVANKLQVAA